MAIEEEETVRGDMAIEEEVEAVRDDIHLSAVRTTSAAQSESLEEVGSLARSRSQSSAMPGDIITILFLRSSKVVRMQ